MIEPVVSATRLGDLWRRSVDGDLVVVHVGTTMAGPDPYGRYLERHLPDARYLSLDEDLADPPAPGRGRHPLPAPSAFAACLASIGVGDATTVVAYDTAHGGFAARLVWMLRVLGDDAALLDGGLASWSGPVADGPVAPVAAVRSAREWPDGELADADDVARTIERGGVVVDSRDPARFRGEHEPIDAVAGHVPGAINLPFTDNLVPADGAPTARWRTRDELDARFSDLDGAAGSDVIVSCGSGVTACHNALAIEHAGRQLPRVYVGSWSGWSTDPDRPVA